MDTGLNSIHNTATDSFRTPESGFDYGHREILNVGGGYYVKYKQRRAMVSYIGRQLRTPARVWATSSTRRPKEQHLKLCNGSGITTT
jgi:hypothetical protein